ncbi:MAG: helix-hairpin-helix domain-containing protein [Oscillospiraceae bacterium]|nr:helix-hairpin-helix domain-containing protein [Oscillospiraceae bacterium]
MRKQTTVLLSLGLSLAFLCFLAVYGAHFMPVEGARVVSRPVPEDQLLAGRDSAGERSISLLRGNPLDLNTADSEELQLLEGIGPVLADAILAYRSEHGGFTSVEELLNVPGIGEKKFLTVRDQVTVNADGASAD